MPVPMPVPVRVMRDVMRVVPSFPNVKYPLGGGGFALSATAPDFLKRRTKALNDYLENIYQVAALKPDIGQFSRSAALSCPALTCPAHTCLPACLLACLLARCVCVRRFFFFVLNV